MKKKQSNVDVRSYADENEVYLYEVANELGLSSNYFYMTLRFELDESKKAELFAIIDGIKKGRDAE